MKCNRKSVLALLLALCIAMSLLCASVWATEEDAPDVSAAAVEVQEEADTAPGDESAAAVEPQEEADAAAEEEDAAPAEEEPALETQAPAEETPTYQPAAATATVSTSSSGECKISLKIAHGTRPMSIKYEQRLIIEGMDVYAGDWKECENINLGNEWSYGLSTSDRSSEDGSWGDLSLVSGRTYQFRVCYTYPDGSKSQYAQSNQIVYYSSRQEQAKLDDAIQTALASGKGDIASENYDGENLKLSSQFVYQRPLYTLVLSVKGSEGSTIQFHAELLPKFANNINYNGIEQGSPGYVEGVDYYFNGYYFVGKDGSESSGGNIPYSQDADFSVDLSDFALGCNYLKLRLNQRKSSDCTVSGLDEEYITEEPFCFNVRVGSSLLSTNSAASTKNSISFGTLDTLTTNVTENGMVIHYRKKGGSWSKKSFKSGNAMKISGLSANTVYEWYAEMYLKSNRYDNGKEVTIWSPKTDTFTVRTADKNKPKVKSYKCSGIKYETHTINAHWDYSYTPARWFKEQKWTTTDYTMKITFKSVPKGVYGYWLDKGTNANSSLVKLKGKTITIKCSTMGKSKGKKASIYLESCTNANGTGRGPAMKFTYKIK